MTEGLFIDSNVFLRHLLNDHPVMSPASRRLLKSVESGDVPAWTTPTVVSEVVWVLGGGTYYKQQAEIGRVVSELLRVNGLAVEHRAELTRACGLFAELNIDFADAYHASLLESRGERRLYSYDRDFDRVTGLMRIEP